MCYDGNEQQSEINRPFWRSSEPVAEQPLQRRDPRVGEYNAGDFLYGTIRSSASDRTRGCHPDRTLARLMSDPYSRINASTGDTPGRMSFHSSRNVSEPHSLAPSVGASRAKILPTFQQVANTIRFDRTQSMNFAGGATLEVYRQNARNRMTRFSSSNTRNS